MIKGLSFFVLGYLGAWAFDILRDWKESIDKDNHLFESLSDEEIVALCHEQIQMRNEYLKKKDSQEKHVGKGMY